VEAAREALTEAALATQDIDAVFLGHFNSSLVRDGFASSLVHNLATMSCVEAHDTLQQRWVQHLTTTAEVDSIPMSSQRHSPVLLMLLSACLALPAACGDDDDSDTETSSSGTPSDSNGAAGASASTTGAANTGSTSSTNASGTGELSIEGLATATDFTPSGPLTLNGPTTNGPTCATSGSTTICSSSWITQWFETNNAALAATLTVSVGSATTPSPGPQPGSRVDLLTVEFYDARSTTGYRFSCGTTPNDPCDAAAGVAIDLDGRIVQFDRVKLSIVNTDTAITLNGTLSY